MTLKTRLGSRCVLFALAAAALLLAASPAARAQTARGPVKQEVSLRRVQAALPALELFTRLAQWRTGVPGLAIAIVYKDQVVYLKGFGVREAGKPGRVDADTVFQLASMSKPVSATVVASLVGKGVLSWDDPVLRHDPGFEMFDPAVTPQVTIRDFFAHQSGLPGDAGNDLEQIGYERPEILRRLRYLEPSGPFRVQYAYSNFGLTQGAEAAAKAMGKPWEQVAAEELYGPLGMTRTSSRYAELIAHQNRARLHIPADGTPGRTWAARVLRQPDAQSPAGGISSSARDLAQWLRLELANGKWKGKQLIEEAALAQTHLPQIVRGQNPVTGAPSYYGLGWGVDRDAQGRLVWSHAGAFSQGARTLVHLLPAEELGIIVLANAFPTGVPEGIAYSFLDLVLNGRVTRDWVGFWDGLYEGIYQSFLDAFSTYTTPPAHPAPALPLSAYVGVYANDYVGEIEIVERDGGLALLQGPAKMASPLRHWDGNVFVYEPFAELPGGRSGVRFAIGGGGQAQGVDIETYEGVGKSGFARVPALR